MIKCFCILPLVLVIFPCTLDAAPASMEKEYQQVRTIALRDRRVQEAYRDADRKLDEKIIKIDPALESYVKAKAAAREGTAAPKTASPAARPPAKPFVAKTTHVVALGETLGGIAAKYHVTVAALKSANNIQDERKLRAGQSLTIPAGGATR
jgi:LysM repeat protein